MHVRPSPSLLPFRTFMYENFFNHVDIVDSNINLLNGEVEGGLDELTKECER